MFSRISHFRELLKSLDGGCSKNSKKRDFIKEGGPIFWYKCDGSVTEGAGGSSFTHFERDVIHGWPLHSNCNNVELCISEFTCCGQISEAYTLYWTKIQGSGVDIIDMAKVKNHLADRKLGRKWSPKNKSVLIPCNSAFKQIIAWLLFVFVYLLHWFLMYLCVLILERLFAVIFW